MKHQHWSIIIEQLISSLMYVNGALSIALLVLKSKIDIPLLLFVIFEFVGSLSVTTGILLSLLRSKPSQLNYCVAVIYTFSVLCSTTVGIYWIDNILFKNVLELEFIQRRLRISFATFFNLSLLLKPFLFLKFFPMERSSFSDQENLLSSTVEKGSINTHSTLIDQTESSGNDILNEQDGILKSFFQTNKEEHIVNSRNLVVPKLHKTLQLQDNPPWLSLIPTQTSACETTETSEFANSTPDMFLQSLVIPEFPVESSPVLEEKRKSLYDSPPDRNQLITGHISEEQDSQDPSFFKHSNFEFPPQGALKQILPDKISTEPKTPSQKSILMAEYDEQNIRQLNISEPLSPDRLYGKFVPKKPGLNHITQRDWNNQSYELIQAPSPSFNMEQPLKDNDEDINIDSLKYGNMLFEELKKEIKQNDQKKMNTQISLPTLKSHSSISSKRSLTRVIRESVSSSTLNNSAPLKRRLSSISLRNHHKKSHSLSAISGAQLKPLYSPLKLLINTSDFNLNAHHKTKESDDLEDEDLDINLLNAIHNSPKKKSSSRSIGRSQTFSSNSTFRPRNLELLYDSLKSDNVVGEQTTNSYGDLSPSKISNLGDILGNAFVSNVRKTSRVFSGTDKSTVSGSSVPSGYYGEYDREKWSAFKKLKNAKSSPDISELSRLSGIDTTKY